MKSATEIGPCAAISRASRSAPPPASGATLGAGARLAPNPPPPSRGDQIGATEDHRQRQPLAHVEMGARRELDQLPVRLAVEFDEEAAEAVAEQEQADQLAGLVARLRLPEGEEEDEEEQHPFEQRLVELARMARIGSSGGEDDRPG